jgi:hypothetical protein
VGKILIQIAHSTQKEIDHPNTPDWVKREALDLIYTIPVHLTDSELRKLREIEAILAGNGKVSKIISGHTFGPCEPELNGINNHVGANL